MGQYVVVVVVLKKLNFSKRMLVFVRMTIVIHIYANGFFGMMVLCFCSSLNAGFDRFKA